jgi:hypothetical protein|tara:strand:- start:88 stop:381 length:294 start_codon:yes stop_codon:yes gene_type:complete
MQLRGNSRITSDEPLDITNKEFLEASINGLQSIIAEEFREMGLMAVEVSNTNIEHITEILPPFSSFLLGRLTTLMDLYKELYGGDRMIPWIKNPGNN